MSLDVAHRNQVLDHKEPTPETLSNSVKDRTISQYLTMTSQLLGPRGEEIGHSFIEDRACSSAPESTFSENLNESNSITSECYSLDLDENAPQSKNKEIRPTATQLSSTERTVITPIQQERKKIASRVPRTLRSAHTHAWIDVAGEASPELVERMKKIGDDILAIKTKPKKPPTKSPFFSPPASTKKLKISPSKEKKSGIRVGTVSCIPFPPLRAPNFGLLQEKLSKDPFRLLIGVTFLNRTKGKDAIPIFFKLMEKYPTPADILAAEREDIIAIQYHLGFQTQRAETYQKYAHFWIHDPPVKGKRYRVDHYPGPGDGMDVKKGEVLNDADPRSAWEIGHVTQGRYAIDSWRIFCRDILRGEAEGWNGDGREDGFQPEWMRVQPRDKELIAFLRWMWLKEGFKWDPETGEKEVAGKELMEAAITGKIAWDDLGGLRIIGNEGGILAIDGDNGKMETLSSHRKEGENIELQMLP